MKDTYEFKFKEWVNKMDAFYDDIYARLGSLRSREELDEFIDTITDSETLRFIHANYQRLVTTMESKIGGIKVKWDDLLTLANQKEQKRNLKGKFVLCINNDPPFEQDLTIGKRYKVEYDSGKHYTIKNNHPNQEVSYSQERFVFEEEMWNSFLSLTHRYHIGFDPCSNNSDFTATNEIIIDPDKIRELPDDSVNDGETIRQIALYANKTHDTSLLDKVKKGFEVAGLYPEIQRGYCIEPEKLKK